ncbi:InlB B-repeat-containing protein [Lysinibacillus sp. CD3-6]|uniref:InlB B-repeat-containing protein n=1 Tax=Lysinibacillus sp. CD3-6 TaxID=2892541 RepID=UPI001D173F3B|nr:InlB B-repeat-containing protein [Lysinibacillus sp. CD3-6]UED80504.1 InlB B-repeat-containing protein [Lysinibacillus sp. CD3-6]
MRNYKRINVVLMLVAMLLSIVQPFLDIQVARAAIPAIEPIEPIDIVTGTVYQGTPNSVDILGGLAGAGGYDSGDQTNTAYLKFYLPSGTDYSNAKLSLTPMDSGVTGDISNLKVNIGSSDNWVVNEGFDQPLSILPTKHIGIGKDFSKPFYIFNQFDTPISLPIGDLLTNQNINDIGSENIITLILSSPTMMDDYAVFGNISIIDYDTSPPVEAKHKVSFNVDGGSLVPEQSITHGEKASEPPAPTKVGYTFEGWYTDDERTNQYDFTNNVITANTTLYAKWKPVGYTVNFEVNGGSLVLSQTVAHGEKAIVPPVPTKAGYTFEGWYTDDEGTNQYDFSTNVITANTTIYAKWKSLKYTVSFEVSGGSAVPNQTVAHGEKATVPPAPTKVGYTFEGWYTDDEGTEQYDFTNNVVTANTTLYAKWEPVGYTVNFEVNGGSAVPSQSVAHGKKATVPTTPTKVGYTFEGWYTDDEGTEQYDFTNNVITANTTLYAKWEPVGYTVNFEVNGGSAVPSQSVAHGKKATVPTTPTKVGYTFEGWYTDDEGTEQYDFTNNVITANTTLYAKWEPVGYTVNFEVNGGSAVPNQTVAHGEKATVPPAPTKAGYTFEGWYTDDEGTEQYDFTNNVITANTTLYAKWKPLKYTVSFEVGGGSVVSSQTVAHGEKATVPPVPTKAGYTFEGWYTDDEGTNQYDFSTNVITANTTIYAKWKSLKYTVSFEVSGGSAVPNQTVAHGEKATVPPAPTKAGYTFEGWYTDDEGTNQYDFTNNVITANTTLYAKWEPLKYTVSFEVGGGSVVPNQTVAHDEKATVPTAPTKAGYTFEGWYTDDEGTEQYDFTNNVITANTTLYAKWEPLKYTVSFEVGGGSVVSSQTVAHGEKVSKPTSAPTKAGYTFEGWYTDDERTNQYDFTDNVITVNTTLYAKWKLDTYTVNFEVNGGSLVPNQTVAHGEKVSKPTSAPTKAGYTFEGWYTSSTLDKLFDFNSSSITRNVTIYAKWVSIVSPPTSNDGNESSTPSTNTEHIVVDVDGENGVNLTKTPIIRTTMPDGVIKDHVSMSEDIAKETIEKAKQLGNDTARIIIPDANDKVSEVVVDIPKSSLAQIHAGNIQLEIATMNAIISIPNVSMSNFSNDLYFRLVPIKSLEQQHQVEERILKEELIKETLQSEKVNLIGRPMTIETNMQHRPVTLTLPLPKNITQEQLNNLAIFIEHSDGTKELLRGKVVDYQKDMLGLQFEVTKFSTFSILYLPEDENVEEPTTDDVTHTPYIQGYADGTFRPNAFVTRAQMASMFARQLTGNAIPKSNATFTDTAQHDAKDAIEFVKDASLFNGVTKTSFNPNGFITRAQMAAVAARWIEKHCVDNPNADFCKTKSEGNTFKDVSNNHWAVQAIATVNALGIMTGTTADTFNPDGNLTRAQAVKVLNRLFERQAPTEHQNPIFKDVQSNHWAFYEIQEAAVKHTHNK